jgi:hypothetical protein
MNERHAASNHQKEKIKAFENETKAIALDFAETINPSKGQPIRPSESLI